MHLQDKKLQLCKMKCENSMLKTWNIIFFNHPENDYKYFVINQSC